MAEEKQAGAATSQGELSGTAEIRAWVEYLRDLGVYDLYRREPLTALLPKAARECLVARSGGGANPHGAAQPRRPPEQIPAAPPRAMPALPGGTARREGAMPETDAPLQRPVLPPRERGPEPPSTTYFSSTDEETHEALPPELQAPMPKPKPLETLAPAPEVAVPARERGAALESLRARIGDCTRCPLAYAGRHTVVFGEGDPSAQLMFVGEGPGADEDATGRPFVGKAGQLLNNMIQAMGFAREQVYIANVVKCRPPGNRTPEFVEAATCSQFLLEQIDLVRPRVIVALGSTAATYLLGVRQSLASMRGAWFRVREAKVAVTFHPAYLLRDPRQKAEAWKDLQRVMAELGLRPAPRQG